MISLHDVRLTLCCFVCGRRRRLRGSRGAWESCVRCARPEQQPEHHEGGHASEPFVHPARSAAAATPANARRALQGAPTTPATTILSGYDYFYFW